MAFNMANFFSFLFVTFLAIVSSRVSARDIISREISLVQEPEENYYIIKKSPVVIVCQARNAAEITFTCSGTQIPPSSVESKYVSDIDPDLIQAEIEVTQADLQNSDEKSPFWCQCSAVDIDGREVVTSRKAFIFVSYLKNKFGIQPISTTATEQGTVEFACGAPEGVPKPEIMWRKNKKRLEIENNPRFSVSSLGSLVIQLVRKDDAGSYQCVARNVAGRRESEEAKLNVTALAESAEPDLELAEEGSSARKASGAAKPRTTRQTIKTYFTNEPQDKYYITQDKPLQIGCGVVAADIITFRCNGQRMERERQNIQQGLDAAGNRVIQAELTLTYADVQQFLTQAGEGRTYQCICAAWYQDTQSPNGWGRLDSNEKNGFVHVAYLDRQFKVEPSDVTAALNTVATLVCEPPKGQPVPWVHWMKDRNRLDPRTNTKYSVSPQGHLSIHNVQYEDAGVYNCLAENSVSSVPSKYARLIVTAEAVATTAAVPTDDDADDEYNIVFPAVIPSSPVFLRDFKEENHLGQDGTKTLICAVVAAEQITVDCGGERMRQEEYELKSEVDSKSEKRLLYAKTVITAERLSRRPEDYFCQCTAWYLNAENTWERLSSTKGYVRAAKAPSAAYIGKEFELAPTDTDAYFESEAQILCKPPAGNPTPDVHWLKDGARIDPQDDPNFIVIDGTLFIEYVRDTDEGEYICVAENEAGSVRSNPIQFTVIGQEGTDKEDSTTTSPEEEVTTEESEDVTDFILQEPGFSVDLQQEYYIADGKPATLACTVVAAKTLVFVCNGEVLRETATTGFHFVHPQTQQSIRQNSLTIDKDRFDLYQGSEPYSCVCRAFYQKDGVQSSVESSPAIISIAYLENTFSLDPSDTKVAELERLELLCRPPRGQPEPEISWMKDGVSLTEDERVKVEEDGSLVIEEFEADDEGSYVCVASNDAGVKTSQPAFVSLSADGSEVVTKPDTKVDPEPEPETTPDGDIVVVPGSPYISKDLHSEYYLVKNKPVTIVCEAYSVDSITFTCGAQTVTNQENRDRMEEQLLPDGQSKLVKVVEATINVTKADVENYDPSKKYTCQCFGHYRVPGAEEIRKLMSTKSTVEIAYLKKNFLKEPVSQTVKEGEMLSIQCQPPNGNPEPKVSWMKNGESIEALSIAPGGRLIFPEVQLEHRGEYICVAENDAGRRESSPIQVEVIAKGAPVEAPKCQKLDECKMISSNNPDKMVEFTSFSIQDLCTDTSSFLQCVDQNLPECNVTLTPLEENVRASLLDVGNWFTEFCNRFVLDSQVTDSCDELLTCDVNVWQPAMDNSTYWCRLISSIGECASSSATTCNLRDLEPDLEEQISKINHKICQIGGEPDEVTAEPDGETIDGSEPEPTSAGNDDNSNEKNQEGYVEGKNKGADADDDDDNKDHESNSDNEDFDHFERKKESTAVTGDKDEDSSDSEDSYKGEDKSNEDNFIEGHKSNRAKMNKDTYSDYDQVSETQSKEWEDDHGDEEEIQRAVDAEGSVSRVEGGGHGEVETSVEASKKGNGDNGSAMLVSSVLLGTILQILIAASLSWR